MRFRELDSSNSNQQFVKNNQSANFQVRSRINLKMPRKGHRGRNSQRERRKRHRALKRAAIKLAREMLTSAATAAEETSTPAVPVVTIDDPYESIESPAIIDLTED